MNSQAKKNFFSGLFGSLPSSLLCLFVLPMSAWAQVTFEQKSDPAGLFTSTSATKNLNDVVSTMTPSLSTGGYSFTHWTVNGVRENAPDGQAKNKVSVTLTENTVAIAHYRLDTNDSDSDGVPDWYEVRMFGNLDRNASYDGDGDGLSLADERKYGLAATIADEFMEGGASIRRSGQVFANFGGAKKLSVSSDPAGLLTSSETFPETNSSYTSPNKNGLTSGYYFSHWEVNGVRQADTSGIGLSQISFTMTEDKTVVAKYYAENADTDSDGLPDWYEWREFGNLDNNGTSDPDGDGFTMDAERQFGLSAVIGDEIMEGGASIRRSGQVFANFGGAKKLSVSSDPAGLLTSSETFPETNSSYTSPNKNGLTSGYYFSHWEVNGVRQADTSGIGLSQISFTMTEDKTVVAKYYAENADTDSDGLPDWYEWREFGNLDNNGTSDPDGDGFSMDAEREFGLSAVIGDEIMEGGGSIRRSGTFGYIEFQPNEDDDGDGLTKAQELHYGTSDDNADSDGDGFSDGAEVTAGSDPADADSVPNRPPRDLNSTVALTISENQPVGTIIGEFNATDPDGDAITYHFVNGENNNSLFALDTNGTLKTATTFDYESNASSFTITVQAKDELNATTEGNFTVTLLDVYEPSRENHTIDLNATVDLEMIWVEPGTFMMGSPTSEVGRSNNEGLKSVNIPRGFFLGKYELTQAQYEAVMKGNTFGLSPNPSLRPNKPNFPVEKVSSNHTQTFLEVLNKKQKDSGSLTYRWKYVLPTEAQWEYACRAGTTTAFSWGDSINSQHANYNDNIGRPVNVGQYEPNHWGFYDMHGNIAEWVSDRLISASKASARGGAYKSDYSSTRSANRTTHEPTLLSERIGIRLAYEYIPNRNPSNLSSSHSLVFQENQPSGTVIGEFNATDPDGDTITYHFVSGENSNSLFTIDTNGTIKTATTFDYESNASTYTITVQAKDELNATTEGNFTITLQDVYEDTDGDGFRDSLEASTGSNLNDPTSTPLQQGLVAWYPFDGNASDMSGNGNHGTVNGATLGTDRHGVEGKAYSFDGVDDRIELDRGNVLGDAHELTLSAWIKTGYEDGGPVFGEFAVNSSNQYQYTRNFFSIRGNLAINFDQYPPSSGISEEAFQNYALADFWNHITYTRNGSSWYITIGSSVVSSGGQSETYDGPTPQSAWIGARKYDIDNTTGVHNLYKGSIDDIRIYNRALSADEIELLYRAESPNHFVDSANDLEMIWVEPGTFTMGQTGVTNAEPEHNVTLTKGFYLGKYEVTQIQYEAVMDGVTGDLNATPSNWPNNPNRPVEMVSWNDVQVFLSRLNEQKGDKLPEGWAYVLPTEAQWEYTCRAGTTTAYSWGETISASDANWNHGNDANQTEDVGQYPANPWGFFDIHGNVREWTADAWGTYASGAQTDPFNAGAAGSNRVNRGGSWNDTGTRLRSVARVSGNPSTRNYFLGFRLALRDMNKAPTDLNSTTVLAVLENLPAGQVIGEFNATDSDLNGTLRYQLVTGEGSEGNSLFTLTQGGVLKSNSTFNYEADRNKSIRVAVFDDKNASTEKSFLIDILDMDEGTYPSKGGGTDADPLQIETLSHLNWLSHNSLAWTKSYILTNDINASVTKDWAAGYGFNPIGNSTKKFMGKFNGNGKIIYGLTINRTFRGAVGLFGNARLANISNLGVKNGNVSGSTLVGGIVGNLQSSAVVNCFFDGNVSSPGEKLGGLVGMSSGNSLIRNCYTSGVVTGTSARIGGILGQNFTESKVDKSYSIARVIGSFHTGPLVGLASGGTYIYSSFWDSAATGRAGGKTTTQMKTPETFVNAGWDFNQTGVWKMIRGVTYPKLAWETLENISPSELNSTTQIKFTENLPIGSEIGSFIATDLNYPSEVSFYISSTSPNRSLFNLDTNGTLETATTFDYETNASTYTITVQAKDELNATTEGNFTVTLLDVYEDLDQDGTEDHLDDDIDGDGFTNAEELAYGSDPRSSATLPLNDSNFFAAVNLWFDAERNATALYGHISDWNTSAVTNMTGAFEDRNSFNEDISAWDVSSVFHLARMFRGATSFNQPIGDWDVSSVTVMYAMFNGATSFNQAIVDWNVSSVTSMNAMFKGASAFNQPIVNWDVSSVTNMAQMFSGATAFNQPIADWNVSSVSNMYAMFVNAEAFNQDISDWNVTAVTAFNMFGGAEALSNLNKRAIHFAFSANENWDIDWRPHLANSAPIDLNSTTALTLTENQPVGTFIGEFNASDLEGDAITFHLPAGENNNPLFTLVTNGTLKTATTFDYESNASNYTITIQAKDEFNATTEGDFTVTIVDQNDAPYDLNSTAPLHVYENQPVGTIVGKLTAKDQDEGDRLIYKLVKDRELIDNELFTLDKNGTLSTASIFDYEKNQTFHIRVKVLDLAGLMSKESFHIGVRNVVEDNDGDGEEDHYDPDDDNDGFSDADELAYGSDPMDENSVINKAPEGIEMQGGEILENQLAGTQVAQFIGIDADQDDNLTYRMVAPAQSEQFPFGLSPTGVLRSLKSFDYEVDEHNYSIRVRVSDDRNTSFEKSFTLYLRNQIEDMDGDEIEDFYDDDIDGDGFNNDTELAEGTDPRDPYSSPMLPILKTISGYLDENGSIILRGQVEANGDAKISDFGFVLSPSISLRRNNAEDIWIRGEGRPTQFTLKVEKSPFEGDLYFRAWAKNVAGYGVGPVKKVIFSEEPPLWWGSTEELAGGWKNSSWLGAFRAYDGGWLYHARLGWLYSREAPEQSVWLWQESRGWLWTQEGIWPYLWSNRSSDWIYLFPSKAGEPVYLFDQATGTAEPLR